MAIAADGAGPALRLVMPDGGMVVQAESQVILYQVLARGLQGETFSEDGTSQVLDCSTISGMPSGGGPYQAELDLGR